MIGTDHHVHSDFSDDAVSSLTENLTAARDAGLTSVRMVDHVRTTTTWVPVFVAAVAALPRIEGLTVLTGVEAKLLDSSGKLDIPHGLVLRPGGVDRVLVADHQFPGPDGPWSPTRTRAELAAGLPVGHALDLLVGATIAAVQHTRAQLAHPFSLLPKIGLTEDDLDDDHLGALAAACAATGTPVELNEKWQCPGPRVQAALTAAGVTLVASSDAHVAGDVGRYAWVTRQLEVLA